MSRMIPFLPCNDGFRIIPANLILHLSGRHEIHLVALADGSESDAERAWPKAYCASVTLLPDEGEGSLLPGRVRPTALARTLKRKLAELRPDVLHIEGGTLAPLARLAPPGTFKLLSAHDSLRLRFQEFARYSSGVRDRVRSRLLVLAARRFEKKWYRYLDRIVVTSELDRRSIEELVAAVPVGVIPNGVDLDFFHFNPAPERGRLVFTGNMSWPPNEDAACYFARDILPRIRVRRDDVSLTLAGADPSPRVRGLAETPGVTVTGTLADIRPSIWRAEVYVCPLRYGAGVKNKILEAMALGTPIVATSRSFTGMAIQDGVQALIAESPDQFAAAVLRLLEDGEERRRLSLAGRKLVEGSYTWAAISRSFETYYSEPARAEAAFGRTNGESM